MSDKKARYTTVCVCVCVCVHMHDPDFILKITQKCKIGG